jgi:thioredoxin 2
MIETCENCGQKNRIAVANLTSHVRCGKCKGPLAPIARPLEADPALFDDVLENARVPVLVDFWADWCRPCHLAAPEVQRVAADRAGRAIVLKVDTERYPEIAARYRVQGIPHFVVFSGGRVVFQQSGVAQATEMERWLEMGGWPRRDNP